MSQNNVMLDFNIFELFGDQILLDLKFCVSFK